MLRGANVRLRSLPGKAEMYYLSFYRNDSSAFKLVCALLQSVDHLRWRREVGLLVCMSVCMYVYKFIHIKLYKFVLE